MTRRTQKVAFGTAAALVLAGVACAVLVPGVAGEVLTIVLIAAGLGGAARIDHSAQRDAALRPGRAAGDGKIGPVSNTTVREELSS